MGAEGESPEGTLAWIRDLSLPPRHGQFDRMGSANYLDADAARRGIEASRTGAVASLARPLRAAPSVRGDGRAAFGLERFAHGDDDGAGHVTGSDHLELDCHGVENTHLDALNHVGLDGTWYGGWSALGGIDDQEAAAPSLADLATSGIVTRAVHLDICATRGCEWVTLEEPVTADDLDAARRRAGVELGQGDAVLVDMGRDRFEAAGGRYELTTRPKPGIGRSGAEWLAARDIGLLCWDFLDAMQEGPDVQPVHLLQWAIGLLLVDNCTFDTLRGALGDDQHTGCLVVAPLRVAGATGNNVNPLVIA